MNPTPIDRSLLTAPVPQSLSRDTARRLDRARKALLAHPHLADTHSGRDRLDAAINDFLWLIEAGERAV